MSKMLSKEVLRKAPVVRTILFLRQLYFKYSRMSSDCSLARFVLSNYKKVKFIKLQQQKDKQIKRLIDKVDIVPVPGHSFFYSIDPFVFIETSAQVFDNYSIDYSWVVDSSFSDSIGIIKEQNDNKGLVELINSLRSYVSRINSSLISDSSREELLSLFARPSATFHEALQRILFINQWLWQTKHKLMGLGHLDWLLNRLYEDDINSGRINRKEAKEYLVSFFEIIHDKCWYKSSEIPGDTGQIIILGGLNSANEYLANELTYLFLEVSKELKLPDPKVLLRVSCSMPDDLLQLSIETIATGIGAPLLSNDDVIIPHLLRYGYDREKVYNYGTSACWEPLIIGNSCEQNNIGSINYCKPFDDFSNSNEINECKDISELKAGYFKYLEKYLEELLPQYDQKVFEEDPILTIFSPEVLESGKDITKGGAKYNGLGFTSVGLASVVNSLKNIEHFVFENGDYSIKQLNLIRESNYEGNENVRLRLYESFLSFGCDDSGIISLTNEISSFVSQVLEKHKTHLGGRYKFGLSSPNYIPDARQINASFDGRRKGMPFGVHISGKNGVAPTELIGFASKIDYSENRINGNVVDFILSPDLFMNNENKVFALLKGGIMKGFFQLQINVVDSATLIKAQSNPELFPNLVVRVWGFSAYFKDLPKEYQDNLIRRAIEAECIA